MKDSTVTLICFTCHSHFKTTDSVIKADPAYDERPDADCWYLDAYCATCDSLQLHGSLL
jgi:hypothetical protein